MLVCLAVCACHGHVNAQTDDAQEKSKQIDALFACSTQGDAPGASVVVIQGNTVLHKKGYGLASVEENVPNTPDTIFRLGSITKSFTAMAILQLHERGRLHIDDPAAEYFPDTAHGHKVRLRHMLTHTSGIHESLDAPLEFTPGEQMSYSNAGYNLLGKIIEKVSGDSYDGYLRKNIFEPLGMVHTGFEHPGTHLENRASGYEHGKNGIYTDVGQTDVSGAYAAGALYSTVEDMHLWDQALNTEKLLKAETLKQAFSRVRLNDGTEASYGFGWMINQHRGLRTINHGGDISGFNSYMGRFPDEQFTVIVLSNIAMRPQGPLPTAGDLARQIAEIYLADKMSAKAEIQVIELDPKLYDAYAGQYRLVNVPQEVIDVSGEVLAITREDDRLHLQSKLGKVEIVPETEARFLVKQDNSIITFTKEDTGQVTGFKFDAMGLGLRVMKAEKLNDN